MSRMWTVCVFLSAVMIGALGCDDDDGGDISSGVNSSKQLDELSDAEGQQMCEEFASALTDLLTKDALCKMTAVEMGESMNNNAQLCQTTYDQCMNSGMADTLRNQILAELADCSPDDNYDDGTDDDGTDDDDFDCSATVGEAEKCINDMIDEYEASVKQLSCDDIGSFKEPEEPASCEVIDQKCPGFMDTEF